MHFALVKKIWGPFFDHFVAIQILTILGGQGQDRIGIDFTSKLLGKSTKIGIGLGIGIANSVSTTLQTNY